MILAMWSLQQFELARELGMGPMANQDVAGALGKTYQHRHDLRLQVRRPPGPPSVPSIGLTSHRPPSVNPESRSLVTVPPLRHPIDFIIRPAGDRRPLRGERAVLEDFLQIYRLEGNAIIFVHTGSHSNLFEE
jgi:hypothetical protein